MIRHPDVRGIKKGKAGQLPLHGRHLTEGTLMWRVAFIAGFCRSTLNLLAF